MFDPCACANSCSSHFALHTELKPLEEPPQTHPPFRQVYYMCLLQAVCYICLLQAVCYMCLLQAVLSNSAHAHSRTKCCSWCIEVPASSVSQDLAPNEILADIAARGRHFKHQLQHFGAQIASQQCSLITTRCDCDTCL